MTPAIDRKPTQTRPLPQGEQVRPQDDRGRGRRWTVVDARDLLGKQPPKHTPHWLDY